MILIRCINLRKTYQIEGNPLHAILDCSIEVKEGECVVICGTKGSGKTTLLRLLGGYETPSGGTVSMKGNNITLYKDDQLAIMRRKEVAYLYRNDNLLPELTVYENIIMPTLLAKTKYETEYYEELVELLHITDVLNCYPKQLNQNQKHCVAYARALINNPDIFLLDEPDGGFYLHAELELLRYLLKMVENYCKTLIIATNEPQIISYADHMIKLRRGSVVEDKIIRKSF